MITLEDFADYFFVDHHNKEVKNEFIGGQQYLCGVQANHKDGRKFSHTKIFDAKEFKRYGVDQCRALTLSELLEKLNEDEQ